MFVRRSAPFFVAHAPIARQVGCMPRIWLCSPLITFVSMNAWPRQVISTPSCSWSQSITPPALSAMFFSSSSSMLNW